MAWLAWLVWRRLFRSIITTVQRARSIAHSSFDIIAGFSLNVTLRGFASLFAAAFFLEGMFETTTTEKALERRAGEM
jgi:hypothetical protein